MEKADNNRRGGNQSSRNTGATNGQPLQKLCTRIQKETCNIVDLSIYYNEFAFYFLATNITFFYKDQTLIVTVTGRPENVRAAQVQILRELSLVHVGQH